VTATGVYVTAAARRLLGCPVCGLLLQDPPTTAALQCPRCASAVSARKPNSLQRSVALLLAAACLYIPANVMPILHTTSVGHDERDTIFSGIIALWSGGSWPLALLVFTVSMVVPALKFVILGFLIVSTHCGSRWALHDRTLLYRLAEFVGRWSMLDIFVVALMVTLVQLRGVATIEAGPGAVAFAAVVILMMYAVQAFDPRLMWDRGVS
jgi:paraquat-inducible protein A